MYILYLAIVTTMNIDYNININYNNGVCGSLTAKKSGRYPFLSKL